MFLKVDCGGRLECSRVCRSHRRQRSEDHLCHGVTEGVGCPARDKNQSQIRRGEWRRVAQYDDRAAGGSRQQGFTSDDILSWDESGQGVLGREAEAAHATMV